MSAVIEAPTKAPKYKSILGTVELHHYVDPHPGKAATDRVPVACDRCGGKGHIVAYRHIDGGRCFQCYGSGRDSISVATARKWAKDDAFIAEYGAQVDAYWAEFEAAQERGRKEREFAQAWDDAHAEATRRAAMNQNVLGAVGQRLKGIAATVTVSTGFERTSYTGYGTDYVKLVIFTTEGGEVIKISGQADALYGLNKGDKVLLTATVKEYGDYNGQRQTIMQRPKIEIVEKAEED
jgi:hypothetical protein